MESLSDPFSRYIYREPENDLLASPLAGLFCMIEHDFVVIAARDCWGDISPARHTNISGCVSWLHNPARSTRCCETICEVRRTRCSCPTFQAVASSKWLIGFGSLPDWTPSQPVAWLHTNRAATIGSLTWAESGRAEIFEGILHRLNLHGYGVRRYRM